MKYVHYSSKANTVGLEETISSYWELDDSGEFVRSVDVLEDGKILKYDEDHEADSFGQLPEGPVTEANIADREYGICIIITAPEFEVYWSKKDINYGAST